MSKHTPGQWMPSKTRETEHCIRSEMASKIAIIPCDQRYIKPDEQEANARLIAAAPDLLAALEQVLYEYYDSKIMGVIHETGSKQDRQRQAFAIARDAIAKAKGE